MDLLRAMLGVVDEYFPDRLVKQYRAPPYIDAMRNVLISPRGIHCYVDEDGCPRAWMGICNDCMGPISRQQLPPFAIANGFFVGEHPERLKKLTIPERFVTQLTTIAAISRVNRSGRHRCIRSHCVTFDCTPGAPISLLPRSINEVASYRVAMVGDFTEGQMAKVKRMHRIRSNRVEGVFSFYKAYSHWYEKVVPSDDVLDMEYPGDVINQQIFDHVEDGSGFFSEGISTQLESIRGQSDVWQVDENDERVVLEQRVGLTDDTSPVSARDNPFIGEVSGDVGKERAFMIRRSDMLSNDVNGDLFARLFPHLFPFGRGHPGETRRIDVSLKEAIKYYISLSGRQFAEDELFTLVAFDRMALQNMYIQNQLQCRHYLYERYLF